MSCVFFIIEILLLLLSLTRYVCTVAQCWRNQLVWANNKQEFECERIKYKHVDVERIRSNAWVSVLLILAEQNVRGRITRVSLRSLPSDPFKRLFDPCHAIIHHFSDILHNDIIHSDPVHFRKLNENKKERGDEFHENFKFT